MIKGSTQPQIKGNLISRIEFMYSVDRQWRLGKSIFFFVTYTFLGTLYHLNSKTAVFPKYSPKKSCEYLSSRTLTLIDMRQGTFHPLSTFGLDFVSWIFTKNFQTFAEVKIDIHRVNLTPWQAHWWISLAIKMSVSGGQINPIDVNFLAFIAHAN